MFSYWNLLAFTTAPLEQISLAFVPAAAPGWRRRAAVKFILGLGVGVGVCGGLASASVPLLAPWLLTRDAAVWPHMGSISGLALGAMVLTAGDVAATGVLLALRRGGGGQGRLICSELAAALGRARLPWRAGAAAAARLRRARPVTPPLLNLRSSRPARRDLRYVAQAFVLTLGALVAFMAAQPCPRTLEHVWHGAHRRAPSRRGPLLS